MGEDSCKAMGLWKVFWRCFAISPGKGEDELRLEGRGRKTQHPTPSNIFQHQPPCCLLSVYLRQEFSPVEPDLSLAQTQKSGVAWDERNQSRETFRRFCFWPLQI